MKILLLTDYYPPESNAPSIRCSYHAEYWAQKGHEVTVLTCAPNFPNGKIYRGYKNKFMHSSSVNGVNVTRCWSFIAKNDGFILRILDHISSAIMFSFLPLFMKRPDIVIASSPQFLTLISGYVASSLIGRPLISEIRDMWPEGIIFLEKNSLLYRILERIELFIYKKSTRIITVTDSFAEDIHKRTKIPRKNIFTSFNGCNNNISIPPNTLDLRNKLNLNGKFIVGYAGTVGISHGLESIVTSFNKIDTNLNAHLVIIGSGAMHQRLKARVIEKSLDNISILEAVTKDEIGQYLSLFNLCLVSLKNIEAYDKVIPSKLFEAASYNKPVIAGLRGEARSIVDTYKFGEVFEAENMTSFLESLNLVILNLNDNNTFYDNGLLKVRQDFSRDRQAQIVLDCIHSIE